MENLSGKITSADGTPIAYERRGDGPPLILVSGALCTAATEAPLADLLAPHFTTYTYDRRGRGGSGDAVPYAVEREVEDLAALVAEAGGSASVYGMSSGGVLALQAAATGVPIPRLAVYEPPYSADPANREKFTEQTRRLERLLADGRRGDALALFLSEMPPDQLAGLRASPAWAALEAVAHTLSYDHAVLGDSLVPTERLATVTTRVLVIDGGASPSWLRDAARTVAHALPNARHSTLTGQTHAVAPQVLAPPLTDFFRESG
ncbi:hydrolase [Streptomyces sp. CB03234]|uniref:alpha/beta fold hydrolase n=1 Tax=Streptomyces sp. (strain CB03234) TaxID=1703937 RepID=UPI00093A5918|nr:alpha/beta hydrolase [Streptomyces sp. CB03234]OKK06671.1 hydrolase [Streptomyces sp. CB03234]